MRLYEWFGGAYERLQNYTSASAADTSGCKIIRVLRKRIRAVAKLYECFGNGYERLQKHSRPFNRNAGNFHVFSCTRSR
ncbi:hypothetical protein [Sporosarcina cyprini]|uniref:hypothetical protein n=1 Tax=Sporosarcina cyprini TaxID=2910523 RepID=UPI001EE104F6|nr:hypothetical protein [Sporosarcina cyprini]MCG3087569.1 hypothetical protein [Sporosarcina cyprini]